MKKTKNMAVVLAIADTLKQGTLMCYNGVSVHSYAEFEYNSQLYRISVEHQHLQRSKDNGITWTDLPIDVRSREKYMFYKSKDDETITNSKNRVICMSKYELNVLLLIPNAFNKYIENPNVYSVNHKAAIKHDLLSYELSCKQYAKFISIINNPFPTKDQLSFVKDCLTSKEKTFVALRAASNNLSRFPVRLRYNDISNLELCTSEENSKHYAFIYRLRAFVPDIEAIMVPYSFAEQWYNHLFSMNLEDRIALLDALNKLPRVSSLINA